RSTPTHGARTDCAPPLIPPDQVGRAPPPTDHPPATKRKIPPPTSPTKKLQENPMKNLAALLVLLCATAAVPTVRAQGTPAPPQQPPTVTSVLDTSFALVQRQVGSPPEPMPADKSSCRPPHGQAPGPTHFAAH